MCMVYLPTSMVEFYDKLVSKYTGLVPWIHITVWNNPVTSSTSRTSQYPSVSTHKKLANWFWKTKSRQQAVLTVKWNRSVWKKRVFWVGNSTLVTGDYESNWNPGMNLNEPTFAWNCLKRTSFFVVALMGAGFNTCAWVMCRQFVVQPWTEEFRVTGHVFCCTWTDGIWWSTKLMGVKEMLPPTKGCDPSG